MKNTLSNKNYQTHWFNWTDSIEKEELFYQIVSLVKDMIQELVPRQVEKQITELNFKNEMVLFQI